MLQFLFQIVIVRFYYKYESRNNLSEKFWFITASQFGFTINI